MDVPYNLENFWNEYGPIIVDLLLALPFVRFFRDLITRSRSRLINENSTSSILRLPDELLLEISELVYLAEVVTVSWRCRGVRRTLAKASGFLSLSRANKRLRNICAPSIFQRVSIAGKCDYGWLRASRSLKAAGRSDQAMKLCTTVSVNVDSYSNSARRPPTSFSRHLAQLLPKYSNVRKLELIVPNCSGARFKKAFENNSLTLPNVRILILNSHLEWIIPMLTNLEVLSTSDVHWLTSFNGAWPIEQPYELIKAAGRAPKLRHFEMHESWDTELLQAVLQSLPMIQSLALPGRRYHDGIQALLPTLSQFRHLRTLALAPVAYLDVGFDPPGCGNVYFGPGGEAYRREVEEQGQRATVYVGELVSRRLKNLEVLWVGSYDKATVLQTERGDGKVVWMHEHRVSPRQME